MRTVIRGMLSSCREVTSGVPQRCVLATIMFLIYVNDIMEYVGRDSYISMFADDAKILRPIKNEDSCRQLQADISTLFA